MDTIVDLLASIQFIISKMAGFGVGHSGASFSLLIVMALFATACISHLADRTSPVHLAFNFLAMLAAGVLGNAALRELHLPMGHELLVTATMTLAGMTGMAVALLFTYRRSDF